MGRPVARTGNRGSRAGNQRAADAQPARRMGAVHEPCIVPMNVELWHRVQQFLFHEARLLDERRLQEWLALYADDAEYWVPYAWGQKSPRDHVSLFYETKSLLGMRVDRLERELSPLESPQARVNHYLSNVLVD